MFKKGTACLLAGILLCSALGGCTGYSEEKIPGADDQYAIHSGTTAKELLPNGKTKDASICTDDYLKNYHTFASDRGTLEIDLQTDATFNTIVLNEKGWNVRKFHIEAYVWNENNEQVWETIYQGERIEDLRYCALEAPVTATRVRLVVDSASQIFSIRRMKLYNIPAKKAEDFRVSAYIRTDLLLDGSLLDQKEQTKIDPKFLDVVTELNLIGNVSATPEGTITITRGETGKDGKEVSVPVSDADFAAALKKLREMIGSRKVELTMTIHVGAHEDALTSMTKNRDALLKNTMAFLQKFGLDGVSYDWERPQNQEQFDAFSDYLIALRQPLTQAGKRLTLAWAPWGVNLKPEAVKTADAIEMMTYDLFDQYGNQASFMESTVQAVDYFLSLGYNPSQLHIGLPYYGRPEDGGETWPSYNDPRFHLGKYDDMDSDYVADFGKCYFNSYQTVMDKTAYAIDKGLGGVMVFRLELDRPYDDEVSLTKAIGNTINQRIVKE